jgi:tripartite-type tricarboxylate transporter receptor subunit TctC
MSHPLKTFRARLGTAVAALALSVCSLPVAAQDCAPGPLRLVLGLSAGGGMDALARMLAERMATRYGQTVVVENKVGASGNIAAEFVARAPRDGCTLLFTANHHNVNPLLYAKAGYDPQADFVPVIRAVEGASVLVANAERPFKTLKQLVDFARANPGKLSYASSGIGLPNHVAMEMFTRAAGIDVVHVPYKGAAPAITDTIGGVVPLAMASTAAAQPYIASGKLLALAVSGRSRWPTLPEVPTMAEAGFPEATNIIWMGILAPAGTPPAFRAKLNAQLNSILQEKAVRDRLFAQGFEPANEGIAEFDAFLREDLRISRKIMQDLKLKVE